MSSSLKTVLALFCEGRRKDEGGGDGLVGGELGFGGGERNFHLSFEQLNEFKYSERLVTTGFSANIFRSKEDIIKYQEVDIAASTLHQERPCFRHQIHPTSPTNESMNQQKTLSSSSMSSHLPRNPNTSHQNSKTEALSLSKSALAQAWSWPSQTPTQRTSSATVGSSPQAST